MEPRSKNRGQTLVLMTMSMLALTLMALMTLAIASRVRDRIELQTLADTSAYTNAVATARTYNTAALLNRAMVSQWSAMCGIAALHAWGSSQNAYFYAFAATVQEINDPNSNYQWPGVNPSHNAWVNSTCKDGNGYFACQGRWTIPPAPVVPGSCDDLKRKHVGQEAQTLFAAGDLAWGRGFGALDTGVSQQAKDLWQSMDDLGRIQTATYTQLKTALTQQTLTQQLVQLSGIKESVSLVNGTGPTNVAWREVNAASPVAPAPTGNPAPDAHMRAMAQAVMGTRGDPFFYRSYHPPLAFTSWMAANGRGNGVTFNFPNGEFVRYSWLNITRNTSHPGTYCQGDHCPMAQSVRSQPPISGPNQPNNNPFDNNQMDELYDGDGSGGVNPMMDQYSPLVGGIGNPSPWRGPSITMNWDGLYGGTWAGDLRVEYNPPNGCPGGLVTNWGEADSMVWYTVPVGPEMPRHYTSGHRPGFDEIVGHVGHAGESASNAHVIGNNNTMSSVLPFSVGFMFPSLGDEGAKGAWGQPKTPVLLKRDFTHKDPWNVLTGMRFQQGSTPNELDLQKGFKGPVALGNAIAYYHRTSTGGGVGAWNEAPSFLNPFWRATLVPLDIDERPKGGGVGQDNTPTYTAPPPNQVDAETMLKDPMFGAQQNELKAYQQLTAAGYKGGQ